MDNIANNCCKRNFVHHLASRPTLIRATFDEKLERSLNCRVGSQLHGFCSRLRVISSLACSTVLINKLGFHRVFCLDSPCLSQSRRPTRCERARAHRKQSPCNVARDDPAESELAIEKPIAWPRRFPKTRKCGALSH